MSSDVEYYNDLPNKTPPEFSPVQKNRPKPLAMIPGGTVGGTGSNLIDFHSDLTSNRGNMPEYVNDEVPNPRKPGRDPFDMSKYQRNMILV